VDGTKLATLRREAHLSQARLARRAELDPTTISDLELGLQTNPTLSTLLALARALRCRVVDFAPELASIPDREREATG
jgi:transcriptional regulator with XRE-family HTH domain